MKETVLKTSKAVANSEAVQTPFEKLTSRGNFLKWFGIIAIVVVIGFSTASCGGGGSLGNAKWEYKVFRHYTEEIYTEELNEKLNEHGKQGWELVSSSLASTPHSSTHILILKRKL